MSLGRPGAQGTCTWLTTPYLLPPLCPLYSHRIRHERLLLVLNKQEERKHFQSWQNRQLWVRRKVRLNNKQPALTSTQVSLGKRHTHTQGSIATAYKHTFITTNISIPYCIYQAPFGRHQLDYITNLEIVYLGSADIARAPTIGSECFFPNLK